MNTHQDFMTLALELASKGKSRVAPNPMVGAVLVYNGEIISEGYHSAFGQPHAEAEAIQRVKDPALLPYSTLYVNLEPCSHYGKTPPCADLIIQSQIPEVVIGCTDESKAVSGKGIQKLKEAGVSVQTGILQKESWFLNRRFFTFHEKQRPFVILKWAQTADGFLADENGDSRWISNPFSRQYVHKWRSEESAIMVGTQTALKDNPRLTVRNWQGKNPLRVLLDKSLKIGEAHPLYNDEAPTWILNQEKSMKARDQDFVKLDFGSTWLEQLFGKLWETGHNSLLVEGGAQLLKTFIDHGLWDEARVFTNPQRYFLEGTKAPLLPNKPAHTTYLDNDILTYFFNKY